MIQQHLKKFAAASLVISLFLSSCKTPEIKTVIRPPVVESQPSFDENVQDSGIKSYVPGKGFEVSSHAVVRYNALIFVYGARQVPPIIENQGVIKEGDKIYMTSQAMVDFIVLNQKFKRGEKIEHIK